MALSEIGNGIGDKFEGSTGIAFEPGEYVLQAICDTGKGDPGIYISTDTDKEGNPRINLDVCFEAVSKANGEECGKFKVFKRYWDLAAERKDYVALLKFTGCLEEFIATCGDTPDYSNEVTEQFLQVKLPFGLIVADVYEKEAKPYVDKNGVNQPGKPRKDFGSIRAYAASDSLPSDMPF